MTIPLGTLGVVVNSVRDDGDIRVGLFPWTILISVLGLAACCLGLLNEHGPAPGRWTTVGAWWTTAALLGIGGFFVAIGLGGVMGIDEEAAGPAIIIPVLPMAFGLLSMTPALLTLGVGVAKAGRLHWWGLLAIWIAAPVLPALLIYGGFVEGTAETIGSVALIAIYGIAWVALGIAVVQLGDAFASQAEQPPLRD